MRKLKSNPKTDTEEDPYQVVRNMGRLATQGNWKGQMNIAEHILARSAGRDEVAPGQIVTCELDLICIDEIQIPIFVVDHYCPPTSHHQATAVRQVRDFAVLTIKEFESAGVAGGAWRPLWPPRKGGM